MRISIFFFLVVLGLSSCEKDVDVFTPYVQTAIEWPEVLKLKTTSKSFNAEENSSIALREGELLIIPANSIIDGQGEIVSGRVDLSLTYVEKKADFIFAYMNSNLSSSNLLEHFHTVSIKAYHNEKPVTIKGGKSFSLKTPMDMQPVTGGTWFADVDNTPNNYKWTPSFNGLKNDSWMIEGKAYSGIEYTANQFGWMTSAKGINSTQKYRLCVSFPKGFDERKTKVYFVFQDKFSVAELKPLSDNHQFCTKVPKGTTGHVIIINQEDNSFKYQNKEVTIMEDFNFSAQPIKTVLENIVLDLNKL